MREKFEVKVYNEKGKDVTNERDWYIGSDGLLYFETSDIDCPLQQAEGFNYKIFLNGKRYLKCREKTEEKEIDLEEAEKEKKAIIEMELNKNKPHHCKCCGSYIEEEKLKVCNKCASEFQF